MILDSKLLYFQNLSSCGNNKRKKIFIHLKKCGTPGITNGSKAFNSIIVLKLCIGCSGGRKFRISYEFFARGGGTTKH